VTVASTASLSSFLETVRARVDAALDAYLPSPPRCPEIISQAMRYSVFAGGKRLRPTLTLAAADAAARRDGARIDRALALAVPAACAVELIHTYSLIHDDLPAMDNDTLRRGRPTLHVAYGVGIAILAGDGLHAEAFALLAREPSTGGSSETAASQLDRRKLRVIQAIGEAAGSGGMVGGQAIDLQAAGQAPGGRIRLDSDRLRDMHSKKTGALIRAAATSGAIIAGADDDAVAAVDRYAADLGLAFQIIDDILDVEGDAGTLGKTAGKDAADEKPTYPALFGIDGSRAMAAECIARARATLDEARLADGWLPSIAGWILNRKS
jgi:geranylgeranyl pyrophosphate synthase